MTAGILWRARTGAQMTWVTNASPQAPSGMPALRSGGENAVAAAGALGRGMQWAREETGRAPMSRPNNTASTASAPISWTIGRCCPHRGVAAQCPERQRRARTAPCLHNRPVRGPPRTVFFARRVAAKSDLGTWTCPGTANLCASRHFSPPRPQPQRARRARVQAGTAGRAPAR